LPKDTTSSMRAAGKKVDSAFKRLTAGVLPLDGCAGARTVITIADFPGDEPARGSGLADFREVNLFLRGMVTLSAFRTTTVVYDRGQAVRGETKYPSARCWR